MFSDGGGRGRGEKNGTSDELFRRFFHGKNERGLCKQHTTNNDSGYVLHKAKRLS